MSMSVSLCMCLMYLMNDDDDVGDDVISTM